MNKYIGVRLAGRYEIQEQIGIGGMANVYKARDLIDDITVAIKILKEQYERVQKLDWIRNKIAYALYQAWKIFDER